MSRQRMRLRAPGRETIWESIALLDKHIKKKKKEKEDRGKKKDD